MTQQRTQVEQEQQAPETASARTPDEETVLRFFAEWEASDPERLIGYFTEDGVYEDVGLPLRQGHEALRTHLTGLFGLMSLRIETLHLASRGNIVFTERIDYLSRNATEHRFDFRVTGVMEMRDGRIAAWRDYADLRSFESGFGLNDEPSPSGD